MRCCHVLSPKVNWPMALQTASKKEIKKQNGWKEFVPALKEHTVLSRPREAGRNMANDFSNLLSPKPQSLEAKNCPLCENPGVNTAGSLKHCGISFICTAELSQE